MIKNKQHLLKEYIKSKIRTLLNEKKQKEKEDIKNLAKIGLVVTKFPGVKKSLEQLMSPSFAYYIKSIDVISPKPTTFRVTLNNNLDFELAYANKSYIAKVSGKKYYLLNTEESQNASKSITDLLLLSPPEPQDEAVEKQQDQNQFDQGLAGDLGSMSSGGGFSDTGGNFGGPAPTGLPELQPEDIPTTPVGTSGGGDIGAAPAPAGGLGSPNP